ncbi:MAG: excinuclease ABC subunit UvrA [Candidatus Saccharibacteria bacterium]|nr:excinuclease ABC subunit UvrA [Candidatus Saccharibacteria bacterium]
MQDFIEVKGARQHNLKNIDVRIPRDKLTVITGLSGSGKSTLAFDTIYAEGQRRYVESLSSYARQFLGVMDKPDVDMITGLSPAISIDQKSASRNPRSTVATVTEIYDYLRLLYARIGVPHCPVCGKKVSKRTPQLIINEILATFTGKKTLILAPLVKDKKGEFAHISSEYSRRGYARVRVDGTIYALEEFPILKKTFKHNIELIVDRLVIEPELSARVGSSVQQALEIGNGVVEIMDADTEEISSYSQNYACPDHPDIHIPELEPRLFSFNAPTGACPVCSGLGSRLEIDPSLIFNPNLTISEGAIRPYNRVGYDAWYVKRLEAVGEAHGFDVKTPVRELSEKTRQLILYGTGEQKYKLTMNGGKTYETTYEGVIPNLERRHKETASEFARKDIERYMREQPCHACHGRKLKPEVLAVTIDGLNIMDITDLNVAQALELFEKNINLTDDEQKIAEMIVKEIVARLKFMSNVGLDYLELGRAANTLSGGEAQRIRLATQIGSGLQGVLYVLDEPSIGLHQRDNDRLLGTLKYLRDLGNTVVVVEHDEDTIREADYLIDVGPYAGKRGGEIVAVGTPEEVMQVERSITGQYLSGKKQISGRKQRRPIIKDRILTVRDASEHNLKHIDVDFPIGLLTVVSGVSGSGKSTLVNQILARSLSAHFYRAKDIPGQHDRIDGLKLIDKAIVIDQSPIGRTPRSNPATYTGMFTQIRDLFAATPEANIRGYKAGKFSFNVPGGRCESCMGDGLKKIEMMFLPDVYVTCEECHGRRYNPDTLEIKYKGKNISEVLEMTIEQAAEFFENIPPLKRRLDVLIDVGLGYIGLGQSATTLSGGEAQRIKLATELSRQSTGRTMYILDEPTTGLHIDDVNRLINILQRLVDEGNTVVVIEHNLDVIKVADYVIDMGPEGGSDGGQVVVAGTPEEVSNCSDSYTGRYLKKIL